MVESEEQPQAPKDATVQVPKIDSSAEVPPPTISVEVLWDTTSITFAAVLYTAAITIVGVLVAPLGWPWRVVYAVGALALLVLGLTVLKPVVIRLSKRAIGKL